MTPTEARDYCKDLIDQLRCERERQGIRMAELAKVGGPKAHCLQQLEYGKNIGYLLTAVKYADALGMDLVLVKKERPAR